MSLSQRNSDSIRRREHLWSPSPSCSSSFDNSTTPCSTYSFRDQRLCSSDETISYQNNGSELTNRLFGRRRGAVKYNRVHYVKGHRFVIKFFRQPIFCAFCKEFLWGFGFGKQGYQCQSIIFISYLKNNWNIIIIIIIDFFFQDCQTAVHKKCHEKLIIKCSGSGRTSEHTTVISGLTKV